MEIFILLGLILLNGLFAMSEIALVTAKKARLTKMAEGGNAGAEIALKLGAEPTKFMSTVQIGITSIGVLSGIVGESVLAAPFADWLISLGLPAHLSNSSATVCVVASVTYFSIVLGELVPKRLGQISPETIACLVARPIQILALVSRPFVRLLTFSTSYILKLLGANQHAAHSVTQDEIDAMLIEGSEAGLIEEHEHTMVRNVLRLDDRMVTSLMIPRGDMVYLDLDDPLDENLHRVAQADYSRFPICRDGLENMLGVLSTKDILKKVLKGEAVDLSAHLQPCVFVPETLTGLELLEQMRSSGVEMVFLVDEYGELQGLVTLQDVLEVLTGEFKPQNIDDAWAIQRADGSWLLDGLIPIPELKDRLSFSSVPDEEKNSYHTLSGLVMLLLGRMPRTGDIAQWENWSLEIVDMDGRRIDKVLASKLPIQSINQ
ncbi:HlyC/CorC family transporter [Chitinibacter bivalviorum]|uniref:HlyC/CorC family transporter n=1 Tax=Chitinibacter bivalviorum TaxID=2739434 RepID=A0A7H9BFJ4_9NEIS|nr:hemolysin family protein [Chitinibacter bivalviorum]QLG87345.1 HlyC/CorC family transporter [Chitinibacter bivalviorum]